MAIRPLTFGLRFRDSNRTVRVRASKTDPNRYEVEERRGDRTKRREYSSLNWALRDFAKTWRNGLH